MKSFPYFLFLSILYLIPSCTEPEVAPNTFTLISQYEHECAAIMTEEEADELLSDCRLNELESEEEIAAHLLGNWSLIGIIHGWVGFEPLEEKCVHLTITEDRITVWDIVSDEKIEYNWELIPYEVNIHKGFRLETGFEGFGNKIGMETYCEKYMFGADLTDDADLYIYEKLP